MEKEFQIDGLRDAADAMCFRFTTKKEEYPVITKVIGYETLMKILKESYREEEFWINMGKLPEGYIDGSKSATGKWRVKVYRPAQTRAFMLKQDGVKMPLTFMIPWPALLFEIDNNGSGKVCIVKGTYEKVKKDYWAMRLKGYSYPFGNVSDSGGICMGNINRKVSRMEDTDGYVEAFYDGVTNFDYIASKKGFTNGLGQMEALQRISKRKSFPYEWLYEETYSFLSPEEN